MQGQTNQPRWGTIEQAAKERNISDRTIDNWIRNGKCLAGKEGNYTMVDLNTLPHPFQARCKRYLVYRNGLGAAKAVQS